MSPAREAPKTRVIDRILGPSPREQHLEHELREIEGLFDQMALKHENFQIDGADGSRISMHEALTNIDLMLDAQGWTNIFEYDEDAGLTLRQVKEASKQLRELVAGNPFIGNGARIRAAHVWAGGVEYSCRNKTAPRAIKPLTARVDDLTRTPWATRYIFGNKAHAELERAAFTDGTVFLLGRDSDKRIQRVQLQEITGALHNPNNSEEIWAYRRTWTINPQDQTESPKTRTRWYYTDMLPVEDRRPTISTAGRGPETAELGYTMLDFAFNRQVGWAFGVPDALCVIAWARLYKEFLVNGYVMSRSLAKLAWRITVNNAKAGANASAEVAAPGQAGSAYLEGSGNTLTPLASAGKGYDFASGNGLAGAIAAGLGVSLLALLSNPSAATGSNAAAQTLDPIAKATAAVRRGEWDDEMVRLFRFYGLDRQLVTTWRDLPTDTLQRIMQAWTLVDAMEVFEGETLQKAVAAVMDIADPGELPKHWKPRSERGAITDSTAGNAGATTGSGQGADDGSGGSKDDHDDDE
jgi:hypothetical protein